MKRRFCLILTIPLLLAIPAWTRTAAPAPASGTQPRDIGLVETAGTHLAQLDVTLSGDADAISALTPDDFEVALDRDPVRQFVVDRVCMPPAEEVKGPPPKAAEKASPPFQGAKMRPATYLFFFDQPHLTAAGRQRSMDVARDLVKRLVVGENRGIIVSSARDLATVAPSTSDSAVLVAAIERLAADKQQWDTFSFLEDERVADVVEAMIPGAGLPGGGTDVAIASARRYQVEERWQMERSMHRLSMVLGSLAEIDPPKALFYFADTTRSNPGEHYLSLFGNAVLSKIRPGPPGQRDQMLASIENDSRSGALALNRIVNEASAVGVRLYTIQAEGLVAPSLSGAVPLYASTGGTEVPSMVRTRDAQDTLGTMALETGGEAFLNGIPAGKIARRVAEDLACLHLISFDASGFPQDRPLAVHVRVRKPGVTAHVRGRLIIQSESSRLTSRLLGAFATPDLLSQDSFLRTNVVPTGYSDGNFTALVQAAVPASPYPNASWEIGTSLVFRSRVREDGAAKLTVGSAGVPLVFEKEMSFPPGTFEIVSVARETTTNQIAARRVEGSWPDPLDGNPAVGPIAVLQQSVGAFVREGETRRTGSLARGESDLLDGSQPTALVTVVCRAAGSKAALVAERKLVGETPVNFPPLALDLGTDVCAQVRDVIPGGVMGPGRFRYQVRLLDGSDEVAGRTREFAVREPPPAAPPAAPGAGADSPAPF